MKVNTLVVTPIGDEPDEEANLSQSPPTFDHLRRLAKGRESNGLVAETEDNNVMYLLSVDDKVRNDFLDTIAGLHVHEHVAFPPEMLDPTKYEHASFISQDDRRDNISTVREELIFTATLAWKSFTREDEDVIDELIKAFKLSSVAATRWGKLNDSQKLRLSIACELLFFPSIMYVRDPILNMNDEDSHEIVSLLNAVADARVCKIVCTLNHAPYELFLELRRVLLLSQTGDCLFFGDSKDMEQAFRTVGLTCPQYQNVGDFVLSCTRTLPKEKLPAVIATDKSLIKKFHRKPFTRARNPLIQFNLLMVRELRRCWRDTRVLRFRFISTALIMGFFALIFMSAADISSPNYNLGSHFGSALFPLFSTSIAAAFSAVGIASEARPVTTRERVRGLYSTFPYLVAKMLPELVINLVLSVMLINELSWSIGWKGDMGISIANVFVCIESSTSYAWFFAAAFAPALAFRMTAVFIVPQFLFLGTVVRVNLLPVYLQWVSWICTIGYGVKIAVLNELKMRLCPSPSICLQWSVTKAGLIAEDANMWWYFLFITLVFVVFRALAVIVLEWKIRRAT